MSKKRELSRYEKYVILREFNSGERYMQSIFKNISKELNIEVGAIVRALYRKDSWLNNFLLESDFDMKLIFKKDNYKNRFLIS